MFINNRVDNIGKSYFGELIIYLPYFLSLGLYYILPLKFEDTLNKNSNILIFVLIIIWPIIPFTIAGYQIMTRLINTQNKKHFGDHHSVNLPRKRKITVWFAIITVIVSDPISSWIIKLFVV